MQLSYFIKKDANRDTLKKVYDVIISVHDITNKILSRDSNYIVDVVM